MTRLTDPTTINSFETQAAESERSDAAPSCASCGDKLDAEERGNPYRDEGGDPICDRCHCDKYEGQCDRCGEIVEKKELDMHPGEILAFWEEVDGLEPGYYRVLRWPIYMDGMIEGYVLKDNLEYFAPLDEKGQHAADNAWTPGGRMCRACREEISQTKEGCRNE